LFPVFVKLTYSSSVVTMDKDEFGFLEMFVFRYSLNQWSLLGSLLMIHSRMMHPSQDWMGGLHSWIKKLFSYSLHVLFAHYLLVGSADNYSLNGEVAVTCLKNAISYFSDHADYLKNVAAMIFPLLLVLPQVVANFIFNICFSDRKLIYFDLVLI